MSTPNIPNIPAPMTPEQIKEQRKPLYDLLTD